MHRAPRGIGRKRATRGDAGNAVAPGVRTLRHHRRRTDRARVLGEGQQVAEQDGATETIDLTATSQSSGGTVPVTVNVPGGQTVTTVPVNPTDLTTTNYLARPATALTTRPQRIDVVRALRDQTLDDIATQKGVSTPR